MTPEEVLDVPAVSNGAAESNAGEPAAPAKRGRPRIVREAKEAKEPKAVKEPKEAKEPKAPKAPRAKRTSASGAASDGNAPETGYQAELPLMAQNKPPAPEPQTSSAPPVASAPQAPSTPQAAPASQAAPAVAAPEAAPKSEAPAPGHSRHESAPRSQNYQFGQNFDERPAPQAAAPHEAAFIPSRPADDRDASGPSANTPNSGASNYVPSTNQDTNGQPPQSAPNQGNPNQGNFNQGGNGQNGNQGAFNQGNGAPGTGNPNAEGLDANGNERFEGRNPLRFRGGRAQMRQRGNEMQPRGRNIRPGAPGFQGGQNGQPNEGNFPNVQGNQGPNRRREYDILQLEAMELPELHRLAEDFGIEVPPLKKEQLIFAILGAQAESIGNLLKRGILEILSDGKGFLRCNGYLPDDGDVYVSQSQIKRFNLKTGDTVTGTVRAPKEMERFHGLLRVEAINGLSPEVMKTRKEYEKLTPIFPTEKFILETEQNNITARIIDLVSPIGMGQRGLIVAPPKAGKTTLIKNIANSIMSNHPNVVLIVLLIDERPEEVTDISRSVRGEVVASTFDEMPENHMRVADMVMEKAKRLVEMKQDVVILLDSITRLSRASNLVVTPSGRTLSGGLDPAAMYRPKRMFGAARNIEEGGSLTILATALVDTGSRMDDMIFEEFKGTGNMDLVLDRNLFDQRVFPAIDINKSGTRRDDLLMSKEDLAATFHLRRTLSALDNDKAITLLIDRLKNTKSNADFMQIVAKSRQSQKD